MTLNMFGHPHIHSIKIIFIHWMFICLQKIKYVYYFWRCSCQKTTAISLVDNNSEIKKIFRWSTTSRCILVPFERYGHPKKCAQKVLASFFLHLFHVKTKWNIVHEYLKTKIFSTDTNILPHMHWTSNISGHSTATIGGFWVSLNYPILTFKKTVCPKNVWMRHWGSLKIGC